MNEMSWQEHYAGRGAHSCDPPVVAQILLQVRIGQRQIRVRNLTWNLNGVLVIQHTKTPLGWSVRRVLILAVGLPCGRVYVLGLSSAKER